MMIAAGSGIAPFHGFVQERAAQLVCGRDLGSKNLYFACPSHDDFLYSKKLNKWSKRRAVGIKCAFSSQENQDKKYVQNLLWEDRNEIAQLYRDDAHFYTCGSAKKLGASVKTYFVMIISALDNVMKIKQQQFLKKSLMIDTMSMFFYDLILTMNDGCG
jgi:cytochrome P450/NADPH-cytochrome P450 reductase